MKSFGLWYLANNKSNDISLIKKNEKPVFDLHVNFWSLEDYKNIDSSKIPCLDVGIKIHKHILIDKLTFFCPFSVKNEDFMDLTNKITVKKNANIIFNTDCEIQTKDRYTIIEVEKDKLLAFPLEQNDEDHKKDTYSIKEKRDGTKIEFYLSNFRDYTNLAPKLKKFDTIYIRFRISGKALTDNIYFNNKPLNKSFESAFSGTRMIDFKINEKRNIEENIRLDIRSNNEKVVNFKSVHFLVMEPSAYDVSSFDDIEMNCRELEEGLWDDYLGVKINFSKGHILAYHWKAKNNSSHFSCLVKVHYSKTKVSTVLVYAALVIVLGIISSALVTAISIFFPSNFGGALGGMLTCIIVGILIVIAAIFGGKTKN